MVLPQLYWMELRPIVPTGITAAQLLGKTRPMFDKKFKKRRNTLQNKGCCTQIQPWIRRNSTDAMEALEAMQPLSSSGALHA